MNDRLILRTGRPSAVLSRIAAASAGSALVAATMLVSGCGPKDTFAKVNGHIVSNAEYRKLLEKQTVMVANAQPTSAERLALDTLIGNQVIMAEAAKENVLPSDEEVNRYYDLQKRLFEQQVPGKSYEETMKESGTSAENVKSDMRIQLAETNLYCKLLKITDDQVRKTFENAHGQIGLPPRAQFREIIVPPNSPDYQKVSQALAAPNADFDAIAKQYNLTPTLKSTGGLQQQTTALKTIGAALQSKVEQTPEGKWFGPIDFVVSQNIPKMKAWIKVEKKFPGYTVSFEDAAPLVRRQLMQMEIMQPQNAAVRNAVLGEKLKASFEPTDPSYIPVWDAVKKTATDAGIGASAPAAGGVPMAAPAPGGAAPAAAPAAPK